MRKRIAGDIGASWAASGRWCLLSRHHRPDPPTSAPVRTGERRGWEKRWRPAHGGRSVPPMQRALPHPSSTTTPDTVPAR
ncbi:hypothetical protein GCM10009787_05870 [Streptomyces bangladeshensis]|uniref:Uncharacterized protein n=1 Tax=Streptomyces bangladeshensis TaxID=295352 RepID=A0ABP5N295_9ACTN